MESNKFSFEEFQKIDWNATLPDNFLELIEKDKKNTEINDDSKKSKQVSQIKAEKEKIEQEDEEIRIQIASEVKRILKEKNGVRREDIDKKQQSKKKKVKKKINKPQKDDEYFKLRYTAPKERGIVARIINRMKYENDWYEDVEDYLYDNYDYAAAEIEQSRMAEKRREQRLYKRVQAYEDARDDITMKKAFIGMKVTAIATLLAASGFAANLLINQINDIVNSGYISQEQEKPKLANASEGQIQYAENVLSRIEYDFEHLSHTELLDTVIRTGSKVNDINENRARSAAKDFLNFSDQKLLESILQEVYEDEYDNFSDEKKLELNQLLYEMLDEDAKFWIRSPEKVAEIKSRNETKNTETTEMEFE